MSTDYQKLFEDTYSQMLPYISPEDVVVEIGVRDDRGVISSTMFNCKEFIGVDARPERVQMASATSKVCTQCSSPPKGISYILGDALKDDLPLCDVMITTALIHHHPKETLRHALTHLGKFTKKYLIISGPNGAVQTSVYGDHQYHLSKADIEEVAPLVGFKVKEIMYCDDSAPPVSFFGPEVALSWVKDGQITIVLEKW